MRCAFSAIITFFFFTSGFANENLSKIYLGSREGERASLVENVSTIHGNYSEYEIDLVVAGPDPLILSRHYSSQDSLADPNCANLGGWRFLSQCYLTIQKDPKGKTYNTFEGKFERTYIFVGTSEGSIPTYMGWQNISNPQAVSPFKIDLEERLSGVSNTARGAINAWTNLKNNQLSFNASSNSFELILNNQGRRFYVKHPGLNLYFLEKEILPSGNKIFYAYDNHCRPELIKMTNGSEETVMSWIKIHYGNMIHVESSDGQTVDYLLEQNTPGPSLLTEVIRSNLPPLHYQYRVVDGCALLTRKDLPEGRFTEIDYYTDKANQNKVKTVSSPAGMSENATTQFVYDFGATEIQGPLNRKLVHRFDENLQLVSIEQYLDGSLYRVHKQTWGKRRDVTHLMMSAIEDANSNIFYAKTFSYDDKGNVLEEREYGNLTGASPDPIQLDEDGIPEKSQESHVKTFSYITKENIDIIDQKDGKGNGIRLVYKKGTNLLIKKYILEKAQRKIRSFYKYDQNGALIQTIVDDGDETDPNSISNVRERRITQIQPRKELPHVGAPEIIEEKYLVVKKNKDVLLKRIVNHFDLQGKIDLQTIYDANGDERYCLKKLYEGGLLKMESDPVGNEICYEYDANHNLVFERSAAAGTSFEYRYDLKNRHFYTAEKDSLGNLFEIISSYDALGNKLSEIDRFGNETIYESDDLGRVRSVIYPKVGDGEYSSIKPTYMYQYDLFDHMIISTDPNGEITTRENNLRGQPTRIQYPDGTQELFKYDPEGSLHRHLRKDGTVKVFEYDYLGRIEHIEHYARSNKGSGQWLSSVKYYHNAFHMTSEEDEKGNKATYTYDGAGRLASLTKNSKEVEFFYDGLGRTRAIKKWKKGASFTQEIKEYDLLDHVIEERTEDSNGKTLLKFKYNYDTGGLLSEVIGYPQNQESILKKYDYDGFGRPIKIKDAFSYVTEIIYDDQYINEWGQKALKRTEIDPLGNQTEEIFDALGQVTKVTKKNKKGQILAESECIYDAIGNDILEKNAIILSGALSRTYRVEQTYGPNSQLKTQTYAAQSTDEMTVSLGYNSYADLWTRQNLVEKKPVTFKYYDDGRLKGISYRQKENQGKETAYELSYDKKGNIEQVSFASLHTSIYKFDPNDQLISEKIEDEFGSYEVGLKLDGEGLVQTIQLPDGSCIGYDYEGPFIKKISRLTKGKKELYKHRVESRDLMGNILEETLIGHTGARIQNWDKAGRRIEISTDFFQDKIPEGSYDPIQNIRKREVSLNDEKTVIEYDYDDLSHLISEKGETNHNYSFDSVGNRLKKDNSEYKINDANQVLEEKGAISTFDGNGNIASRTVQEKTRIYHHNDLNQLISIENPDQTKIIFTYNLSGKRLSKKVESAGKKSKIFRYFYLGQIELGCLDEKGVITELRVPADPNHPDIASFIAIEIKNEIHAPIHDLQGNIACLVDPERRKVVETYHYSVFGEERVADERGRTIPGSSVGNPWRYCSKRIDQETGLVYFGYRYYDPEVGRWISPDPAGNTDGPNLYAFCHNNPLTYVDYFGLAAEANNAQVDENYFYGEYEPHCYCERHRDCKRGGDIGFDISSLVPNFATAGISNHFKLRSTSYEVGSIDLPNSGFGYVNGINNSYREAMEDALKLSQYAQGAKVQGIYNATHTPPIDVLECMTGLCKLNKRPVRLLKRKWGDFISTHGGDAKYLQTCTSGGAIWVYNALSSSPKSVRERIIVLAISPAKIIPRKLCYESYNYASKLDFVPKLDIIGNIRYGDQLLLLDTHPDARWPDHGFGSLTLQDVIKDTVGNHLIRYGGIK